MFKFRMDQNGFTQPSQKIMDAVHNLLGGGLYSKSDFSTEEWEEIETQLQYIRGTADKLQHQIRNLK